jgi:excisionase family DNA binding protein
VTMSQAPPIGDRPALDEPLLSPQELADYLAIPVATVYQWRHRGDGPRGFRVGKHVRYRWSEILNWLHENADPAR